MSDLTVALILFLFPLAYSPGPGNMFFAANGARFGLRAALPALTGYHLATWGMTAAIGLGFTAILERAPALFTAVQWAGAGYVLWLAWGLYRSGALDDAGEARPAGLAGGAVLLLLNPKAYLIIALMFSQFLAPGGGAFAVLWITTVFTLNNLVAFLGWMIAGDRLARRFRRSDRARYLNRLFGLVLAAVALWMLLG